MGARPAEGVLGSKLVKRNAIAERSEKAVDRNGWCLPGQIEVSRACSAPRALDSPRRGACDTKAAPGRRSDVLETFERVLKRLREYEGATISHEISEHDAMYQRGVPGALDHYLSVGRSAIALLARAMIIGGRDSFASVLDLPSGAGRITRHLAAFFRDAELFVGDTNKGGEEFAAIKFGAKKFAFPANFIGTPARRFDLIFCGSLLTHLPQHRFVAATSWLIQALQPDGILVATTHGRRASYLQRTRLRYIDDDAWCGVDDDSRLHGFGFVETERNVAGPYGYSFSAPRWVISLLETEASCRVLGYQEAAWDDHQDALIVQKRPPSKGRGET